jgi:hypothetical protein
MLSFLDQKAVGNVGRICEVELKTGRVNEGDLKSSDLGSMLVRALAT